MPTGFLHAMRRARTALLAPLVAALLLLGLPATSAHAALGAPTGLTPNAVSVNGIPVLQWNRVAGAKSYSVEVSTSDAFDSTVWKVSTTNRRAVPTRQLGSGTVYWRVRATSGTDAGDWSTASFDRDELAGPTLLSPAPGTVLSQPTEPALVSWTPVDGAVNYILEVSTDEGFVDTSVTKSYETQNTSGVVPDPQVAQPYYWRVRAELDNGIVTQWSEVRDYQIGGLAKPVLVAPEDSVFTDVEDVVLEWEPVLGAKTYNLQVSTDQNFSDLTLNVNATGIMGTRYSPAITLANDQYYWRVQPVDSSGNKLDWSSVDTWTFRRHWPDQPALEYPEDDAVVGDPFFFQWTPVHLASEYVVQVDSTPDFDNPAQCTTTSTTLVDGCVPGALGNYYWRVIAIDTPGLTPDRKDLVTDSIAAEVRHFTYFPDIPQQLTPADGEAVEVPTLTWAPVSGADQYRVTVAPVADGLGGGTWTTTGTSYTPRTKLTAGKVYRWQVQTISASGKVGAGLLPSAQPTFATAEQTTTNTDSPEPLGSPEPSSRFPTLNWSPVTDATGYKVMVRAVGALGWVPLADKFAYAAGEDDTATWLAPGDYEWMVEAYQGSVLLSSSSSTSTYTILPLASITGQHVAMTGLASQDSAASCDIALPERCTDLRHTPVLAWTADPNAGSYKVWLARDEQMTNVISGYPVRVTGSMYTPLNLLPDSQAGSAYYWFVQPCKTSGKCLPIAHADHAFNKLSKPVETISPVQDDVQANDITFEWRDYLETNQDDTAFPVSDPTGVHTVSPRTEAKQYRVQVSTSANFQTLIETSNVLVDQTTYTATTTTYPEGPLYWRVQALDGSGNFLAFSAPVKFFKSSPKVTLLEPLNGQEVTGSIAFRWEPLPFAASYDVEIFRNADTTGSQANLAFHGNSKQVAGTTEFPMPVATSAYTWRVRPVDAKGRPGPWTDLADPAARFMVVGTPPAQLEPGPDVYVRANDGLFTWERVAGATSYRFERRKVGTTTSTESVVTPAQGWAPTSTITDGTWQWRVSSRDAAGKTMGSSPWRTFLVDGTRPTVTSYNPKVTAKRTANFVVKFSEPVTSVNNSTFKLMAGGTTSVLLSTVTLDATGTKAKLNPSADLVPGKKYTLKLTRGIRDGNGNRLATLVWKVTAK